jgi:cytoskeletal protein CcmA (bactofilin family)
LSADEIPPNLPPSVFKHEIAAGVTISGRLSFPGDARVDGNLRGEIRAHAFLLVGPSAMLQADVRAQRVVVQGTVIGSVRASADVEVVPGGRVIGDVEAERLVVHEGGILEGHCIVGLASRADAQRRSHSTSA